MQHFITNCRCHGVNPWSRGTEMIQLISDYIKDKKYDDAEELLYLLYRDRYDGTEVNATANEAITVGDVVVIREAIADIIKEIECLDADRIATVLDNTDLKYDPGAVWLHLTKKQI